MQEWMAQVDEEFLMRDFEYKSPEELEASLEEMKVRRGYNLPVTLTIKHLGTLWKYGDSLTHKVGLTVAVFILLPVLILHRGLKRMCCRRR